MNVFYLTFLISLSCKRCDYSPRAQNTQLRHWQALSVYCAVRAEYLNVIQSVFTCSNRTRVSRDFRIVFAELRVLSWYAPGRSFERPSRHHFSWFSSVCTRILRLFPGFQVPAVCFSRSPDHLFSSNLKLLAIHSVSHTNKCSSK